MTQEEAVEYVQLHADTNTAPALTETEVSAIVDGCAIVDADGLAPSDDDWTPTYWLVRAVADAWELRVARAATWVDMSTDGTSIASSQAYTALSKSAARWRRRCIGSI